MLCGFGFGFVLLYLRCYVGCLCRLVCVLVLGNGCLMIVCLIAVVLEVDSWLRFVVWV